MRTLCALALAGVVGFSLLALAYSEEKPGDTNQSSQEVQQQFGRQWTTIAVPGTWDEKSGGKLDGYDGFAWYRCWVQVPKAWEGLEIELLVENVDNAHEAFFNGQKLGGAGSFPPDYKSGLKTPQRYSLSGKEIQYGKFNLVALRVFDSDGRGGFKGIAPALLGGNSNKAINLTGHWEFRIGDDPAWSKAEYDGLRRVASFSKLYSTKSVLEKSEGEQGNKERPLKPQESLAKLSTLDDLQVDLVLAEPTVSQPVFMNFDERGRLWVMNYLQYPYPEGLKMLSRDSYWRAVYDKMPEPPPHGAKGKDTITIHEDTNGDGVYDKHKTFIDDLNIATSFARGRGGLWILNPPYLLFYPDKNNDDKPDGPPEVHLQGFGISDTHSVVNSLRWGPDGWLYAAQGSTVDGDVIRPGLDKTGVHSLGQNIWRYHPETRRYEIFAEGGGNAFGVEMDDKGRVYSGHNGGNTRGFHYVQGGYYRKGFGKHGPLSNPFAFGYFEAMKHDNVPRFTHNFVLYEADALPGRYHDKLFGVAPLQSHVIYSEKSADGSTYQNEDVGLALESEDKRFRPVEIKVGPDGGIYVADFYEPEISHRQHFEGQIDRDNGRIYRLMPKNAEYPQPFNLAKLSTEELIGVLSHKNKWYRQQALRIFGDRKDASAVAPLRKLVVQSDGQLALEALWALNLSGGLNEPFALRALEHKDPYVRQWTVRLLGDRGEVSPPLAARLIQLSASEPHVQVRSQLASTAKRLPGEDGLAIAAGLLHRDEDAGDPHLPLLLWWAIDANCGSHPELVVEMFRSGDLWRLPMVQQHILSRLMRRFAASGNRSDLVICAKLLETAPDKESVDKLLAGFEEAYQGRSLSGLPRQLVDALAKHGGGSVVLGLRQGKPEAVQEALKIVADEKADVARRLEFAQIFGEVKLPQSVPVLLEVAGETKQEPLRMAALTALLPHDQTEIAGRVIGIYNNLGPDARSVAQTLLVSRPGWAKQFLAAIDSEQIDKQTVPLDLVRQMTVHSDKQIQELIKRHWKKLQGATSEEMRAMIVDYHNSVVNGKPGDPYSGKLVFKESCGKCHVLFGEGGRVGPDLTAYKRDDIGRMMLNVVNPSAEIREGFETYAVITADGRVLTGFLADRDNQVVVLRGVDGQNIVIRQDEIEEMVKQPKSLMPEGLMKKLTEEQVRDLFAYLRSTQPLNN